MEGQKSAHLFIFIISAAILFGTANSTFQLLNRGFFRQAMIKSILAPKCSPSLRPVASFKDLTEFASCLRPIPWINGSRKHPDQDLRAEQVLLKYGYNVVTYNNVTTKDGYILSVHRILGSARSAPRYGKPAVLLFHGLGTDSNEWVLQSDEQKNLPMRLVNEGYECWILNARGSDLSTGHVSLNSFWDLKYWDFTFHEMGVYDLPAIIDLMLHETKTEKIFFIGHNYGASVYAAALSEMPELNDKIEASVFLGPTIFMGHINNPLRPLFRSATELDPFFQGQVNTALHGKLTFGNWMLNPILARFCTPTAIRCGVCGNLLFFLYGFDSQQINFRDIPNIVSKVPNSISFKTSLHLGQNIKSCDFRKYDYGRSNNVRLYGQDVPPQYNLTNLHAPLYIYFGTGDNLATVEDLVMLRNALPKETIKEIHRVEWRLFNNFDFMIGKDADFLVYSRILSNFNQYSAKYAGKRKNVNGKAKIEGKEDELSVHIYRKSNETLKIGENKDF